MAKQKKTGAKGSRGHGDDRDDLGDVRTPGPGITDAADSGREVAGGAVGGVGGAVGGAAIGAIAGPVGAIIGAVAGAAGGWWAGKEVAASSFDFSEEDDRYYRSAFARMGDPSGSVRSYDEARPLYEFGSIARRNPEYRGRSFEEIEPELRRGWTPELIRRHGDWSTVRGYVNEGYGRRDQDREREGREQRITRAEEELAVGKRQVPAGEVTVRKSVDTEHVSERVPVTREEVTVERRPVEAGDVRAAEIGEDRIIVPVTEEEVIVEKRPVVKEEVVLRTRTVEDTEEVEADLRRERVDVDERGRARRDDRPEAR
jgi:uncharacterized protein (TIGR02271 family)